MGSVRPLWGGETAGTQSCGEEGTGAQAEVLGRRGTKGLSRSQEVWDLGHISQPNYRSWDYEKCVCVPRRCRGHAFSRPPDSTCTVVCPNCGLDLPQGDLWRDKGRSKPGGRPRSQRHAPAGLGSRPWPAPRGAAGPGTTARLGLILYCRHPEILNKFWNEEPCEFCSRSTLGARSPPPIKSGTRKASTGLG